MPNDIFQKDTKAVAKELLGMSLVHETKEGKTVGKIVETEAYLQRDPGSHSHKGMTPRNAQMFGKAGTAYVYFIYGMYHCFNIVTNKEGIGEAVLIRALQPVNGIELMKKRRKTDDIRNLCSGPGKLVIAMGITKHHNGADLLTGTIRLLPRKKNKKIDIVTCTRVGISIGKELPYRFYIKNNPFISKP
ncbi:MAG TPA: DNA-3-methyladenine glycosylase [Candidatus Nanoarchaeia archaeon]|nr:DNA-3-methyladenine glycosylase [Candidatus Nanoarchaeia archaeon]